MSTGLVYGVDELGRQPAQCALPSHLCDNSDGRDSPGTGRRASAGRKAGLLALIGKGYLGTSFPSDYLYAKDGEGPPPPRTGQPASAFHD